MSSLSRILQYAHKHGAPIVIYDAQTDTEYFLTRGDAAEESLWQEEDTELDDWYAKERKALIEEMTSDDLLDQINRDIAIWRAKEQQERRIDRANIQRDELEEQPIDDSLGETTQQHSDWHHAAAVFHEARYAPKVTPEIPSEEVSLQPEAFTGMRQLPPEPLSWNTATQSDWSPAYPIEQKEEKEPDSTLKPIKMEEISYSDPVPDTRGEEEPLISDDTPVFYDEPTL